MSGRTAVAAPWYRADITGLRTMAIIPVVAFHAGASFLPGGFVGVDIFYAISGFLITTLLVNEAKRSGRINFSSFWAKRIRRLVPVLVLVVIVTLPVSLLFSSVLGWDSLAANAIASVTYLSNFLYWRQSTNYFSDSASLNPFLHTWSLSVEEQFYVLWPIAIAAVWFAARRSLRFSAVTSLAAVMSIVFVGSLAYSIFLTPRDPSEAFYLLPSRAWEFAAGALLSLVPLERRLTNMTMSVVVSCAGVGLIAISLIFISDTTPFPGSIALLPVAGTLLVIAGGTWKSGEGRPNSIAKLLSVRPVVWIGKISYSWYLWHWPFIVIVSAAIDTDAWWVKPLAALASLGAAAISYPLIEQRARFATSFTKSVRRTYVAGVAMTVVAALVALVVFAAGAAAVRTEPLKTYAAAASDLPDDQCESEMVSQTGIEVCQMGDVASDSVIMLVGDSHAGQWKEAMSEAAASAGIQLIVRWKNACPALVVNVAAPLEPVDPECQRFQLDTRDLISELSPDVVVVSDAFGYVDKTRDSNGDPIPQQEQLRLWEAAYTDYVNVIRRSGASVAMVDDNPRIPFDPIECLTTRGGTPDNCSVDLEAATADTRQIAAVQAAALARLGVDDIFSVGDDICDGDRCAVVTNDGVPIFLDDTHLAKGWTTRYAPQLEAWFVSLLA